jgi:hypothetical protein
MKNRIENESKSKLVKITIELTPEMHFDLKEMAEHMGATVKQTVEALVSGQPEDYLGRKDDEIWGCLTQYIAEVYGETPRLRLLDRYLLAVDAATAMPSPAERRAVLDRELRTVEDYGRYLETLERRSPLSVAQDGVAA